MEILIVAIIVIALLMKEKIQTHHAGQYADYAMRWREQNVPKREGESYMEWSARASQAFKAHEKSKR